jgi:hypothetical protein
MQVFVKAEPCSFVKGPLEIEESEVEVPLCDFPKLKITSENLPRFYRTREIRGDGECEGGCRERKLEEFIEVDLDLLGNFAVGENFRENTVRHCGCGRNRGYGYRHDRDRDLYVVYLNNAGRLVLTRSEYVTNLFGDFH